MEWGVAVLLAVGGVGAVEALGFDMGVWGDGAVGVEEGGEEVLVVAVGVGGGDDGGWGLQAGVDPKLGAFDGPVEDAWEFGFEQGGEFLVGA